MVANRQRTRWGRARRLEVLGRQHGLGAVLEAVVEGEAVFLVAGQRPIHREIALTVARRQKVIGQPEAAREKGTGALGGHARRAEGTVVQGSFWLAAEFGALEIMFIIPPGEDPPWIAALDPLMIPIRSTLLEP